MHLMALVARPVLPRLLAFLLIAIFALADSPVLAQSEPALELSFGQGDTKRRAILVNEPPPGQLRPVVIVLHGGRGSADQQRARTSFDALAQSEGFMVVYAEGTEWAPRQFAWNTGYLLRNQVGQADDIGYLDSLLDLLIARHRADPSRIYLTGGSNGGMMTFVYGVKRSERLAAIAPVVAGMFSFDRRPSHPLPILMINGGADNEVPLSGGMSGNELVRRGQTAPFKSFQETEAFWVSANGSNPVPVVSRDGAVTTRVFRAGPRGAETTTVVDAVGGHGWPGTPSRRSDNVPIQSFDGAQRVWAFFKTMRRVGATSRSVQPPPDASSSVYAPPADAPSERPRQQGRPGSQGLSGLDTDGDGAVSRAEWLAAGRLEQGFAFMDSDRDGRLSPQELRQGMARLQQRRAAQGGQRPN